MALMAALVAAASPAEAQPATADPPRFGDWSLIALPGAGCVLHQRLAVRESGQTIADLWLQTQADDGAVLSVQVPLGVSLADQVAYRHANEPDRAVSLLWQFCNQTHCLAQGHLAAIEVNRLRLGRSLQLAFRPLPDSAPLVSFVSLSGVTRGLAAQAACASESSR